MCMPGPPLVKGPGKGPSGGVPTSFWPPKGTPWWFNISGGWGRRLARVWEDVGDATSDVGAARHLGKGERARRLRRALRRPTAEAPKDVNDGSDALTG